ncbi:MAG: type II toxin-antitoxin system VapC family toxin [Thermodesulfobacteriota bacterium]
MSGKYLLDTNIVIALFAEDPSVVKHMVKASEIFIPVTVIGELFFGAFKSGRPKANAARIEEFAAINAVLACDIAVSREYGQIKERLHKKGHPIPENDIWIAAIAMAHGLTLVSRDEHFKKIGGLKREVW